MFFVKNSVFFVVKFILSEAKGYHEEGKGHKEVLPLGTFNRNFDPK